MEVERDPSRVAGSEEQGQWLLIAKPDDADRGLPLCVCVCLNVPIVKQLKRETSEPGWLSRRLCSG